MSGAAESPPRAELAPGYTVCRTINGCWQLAADHGPSEPAGESAVEELLTLAEHGFDTFDGADIYTGVEEILGKAAAVWRRRHPERPPLVLHTKYVPDRSSLASLAKADVERAVDRSLRRLGVEALDLVQFHWWEYSTPGWLEAAGWLDGLRRAGKIRHLGLTNFDLPRLRALVDSGFEIVSHQVQYSLLDRRPEQGMVRYCREHGIGLIAYGTLAGGLLSERWLGAPDPAGREADRSKAKYRLIVDEAGGWERLQELLAILGRAARAAGVSIANLAARWVLDRPGVAAVLLGARDASHAVENRRLFTLPRGAAEPQGLNELLDRMPGPSGPIYGLERAPGGRHRSILRTELHGGDGTRRGSPGGAPRAAPDGVPTGAEGER